MQHYIITNKIRVQVSIIRTEGQGIQVEALRAYKSAQVCKGQTFTLPHDQVIKVTGRDVRNAKRSKAHKARMRKLHASEMPLEGPEINSKSLTAQSGISEPTCGVCGSRHSVGACRMTVVLDQK